MSDSVVGKMLKRVDWVLAGLVATISAIGIMNLFSASRAAYGMPKVFWLFTHTVGVVYSWAKHMST